MKRLAVVLSGCQVFVFALLVSCFWPLPDPVFAQGGSWASKTSIPTPRVFSAGGVINGRFHVVGGSPPSGSGPATTALEIYDPETDTWTLGAPAFTPRSLMAAAVIANKLYVVTGCVNSDCNNLTNQLEVYDPATDTWSVKAAIPTPRPQATAVAIGGKFYVVGGSPLAVLGPQFANLDVYDPVSDIWISKAPMPTAREAMVAGEIGGKLYVVGGFIRIPASSNGVATAILEVYDPVTDTWDTTKASMPTARFLSGVGVIGGRLHVFGGASVSSPVNTHESYDPSTDTWQTETPMLTGRHGMASGAANSQLFAVGGLQNCNPNCTISNVVEVFTSTASACVTPPAGLVSWWPGDGNANDIVGTNNGTLQNGAAFAAGQVADAFSFDGIDDFVDAGNAPSLHVSSGDFTVDAWVKFNALSHPPGSNGGRPSGDMSIVDKMSPTGIDNSDGWRLIKQDDNQFWFCFGGGGNNGCTAGSPNTVVSTTTATTGIWFHVVGVKSSTEIAIYVNGVKEAWNPSPSFTDTNSVGVLIGSNALEYARFNGLVDEVEIFNRALSAAEIQAIFNAGSAGKCKPPQLALSANSLDFGQQLVGTSSAPQSVTVDNTGGSPLSISAVGLVCGALCSMSEFQIVSDNCTSATLPAGGSCTIEVRFSPSGPPLSQTCDGLCLADILIESDSPDAPHHVDLAGLPVDPPPIVAVLSPNGGEKLFAGTPYTIEWTASDNGVIRFFDVFFSTNGGTVYNPVPGCSSAVVSGTARNCVWAAPGPTTTAGRILVLATDDSDNTAQDDSNANYSVVSGAGSITVTQPNTALTWVIGTSKQIKWNHNLGINAFVKIELSRDGGASWEYITPSFKNTSGTSSVFNWTVTGPATVQGRVRVTWLNGPVSDISNVNFNIVNPTVTVTQPNTALNWGIGSTQQIKWNHNVGLAATFTIEVSRDGGLNYLETITTSAPATTATTGVYNWTVTGPASTQARVRVTYNGSSIGTDVSNVNFTIANAFISVALPSSSATNWGYGSLRTQNWTTNLGPGDRVNLLMSTDGGATFPISLASNVVALLKTLKVTTPVLGSPTTLARVRVEWVANPAVGGTNPANFKVQPPFVTVTNPNLSTHVWTIGASKTISWTQNLGSLERVMIELSLDGGANYTLVLFASTPSDGSQAVTVQSGWATTQGRVRITWLKDGSITDASNQDFPIQ